MAVRLYLDNNIYAHVQEVGQEAALADWLWRGHHQAVLSDTLLSETIAIREEAVRVERLRLLAKVPSTKARSLGELQAREFVSEVRRLRPEWRRLPVGDLRPSHRLRDVRRAGWRLLTRDPQRLVQRTGDYRDVEEGGIRGANAGQRTIRGDILEERTRVREITLGSERLPTRALDLDNAVDFCRLESLFSWYQATVERLPTLSEYRAYADPYLRLASIGVSEFASFWLDKVDLARLPRGHATSLVIFAQLRGQITHGNSADARHAGHVLDADLMITEDHAFDSALQLVAQHVGGAAEPVLVNRGDPDLVSHSMQRWCTAAASRARAADQGAGREAGGDDGEWPLSHPLRG